MRTRTDEDQSRLQKVFARAEKEMKEEIRAQRGRTGGIWWRAWDAVVLLIVGIVDNVGVDEEEGGEDWLFETLGPYVGGATGAAATDERNRRKRREDGGQNVKNVQLYSKTMTAERQQEVRESLEGLNADYFWLIQ